MAETNFNKNTSLDNIQSEFVLQIIFEYLPLRKTLEIIRINKKLQNKLNKDINSYKEYLKIEIEITLSNNKYGKFINLNQNQISYCHIYLMIIKKV